MMRHLLYSLLTALFCCLPMQLSAQGLPFVRNYLPDQYMAHNRNFDILAGDSGIVYVANFEGLLYYDKAEWHIIHTPGVTRVTTIYRDQKDRLWVGGYNYIGYIDKQHSQSSLNLHTIEVKGSASGSASQAHQSFRGEISVFWEHDGDVYFSVSDRYSYRVDDAGYEPVDVPGPQTFNEDNVNQELTLPNGQRVQATNGNGLIILSKDGKRLCQLTEENGLCNNNVNHISYDGHGVVWGATDKGVFALSLPSKYSQFGPLTGLRGEVTAIEMLGNTMYVGTLNGIYYRTGVTFTELPTVNYPCWQIVNIGSSLLAATSKGIFQISGDASVRQLSTGSATAVATYGQGFLSGEMDGVYYYLRDQRIHISDAEKVVRILTDNDSTIWFQNLYGQIWQKRTTDTSFKPWQNAKESDDIATLLMEKGRVRVVSTSDPGEFPQFSYSDNAGNTWLTDHESKNLRMTRNGHDIDDHHNDIAPFSQQAIRAMYCEGDCIWIGGDFGLIAVPRNESDLSLSTLPKLYFRSIRGGNNSFAWAGFTPLEEVPTLSNSENSIELTFALDYPSLLTDAKYRYRLNEGNWSAWSKNSTLSYPSIAPGSYTVEVQAMDAFGRLSETRSISFSISYPFYMKWYMLVIYGILLGALASLFNKWRVRRLEKEKQRLETIVGERTAEVRRQKDEIEEKSVSLQHALHDLEKAQHDLIRQEKMATAGKLTQGLIDRILNPMNYINNFSKLSCGLVRDLKANIEDEQEHMDTENYEDTVDVLDMLEQNLQKVEEHGLNASRTLKAMEEILKDRSGGRQHLSLIALLHQNEEMVHNYYREIIDEIGLQLTFNYPAQDILINGNGDLLSKTFMSLLGNSVYAIQKKTKMNVNFTPAIQVDIKLTDNQKVSLSFHDNGTGIGQNIIGKIFDPFFTTKPTGEASGVGLYLSHEIIQDHGGEITVQSVKDQYTQFDITLPIL